MLPQVVESLKKSSREDLIMWKDVVASGIVFGSVSFLMILYMWREACLISQAAQYFRVALIVAFIAGFLKMKISEKDKDSVASNLKEKCVMLTDVVVQHGTTLVMTVSKVLRWDDKVLSGKWLIGTFIVDWVFSMVSISTLVFLLWVGAFTLPVGYHHNKEKIDPLVAQLNDKVTEHIVKVPKLAQALGYDDKKKEE